MRNIRPTGATLFRQGYLRLPLKSSANKLELAKETYVTNGDSIHALVALLANKYLFPAKTKMSTLKNNGWKTSFSFSKCPFFDGHSFVFAGVFVKFTRKQKKKHQAPTKSDAFFRKTLKTCIPLTFRQKREHPSSLANFNSCVTYDIYGPGKRQKKHPPHCGIW